MASSYWLVRALKNYFSNTTLHGLKYIVEKNRHWSERLLWTVLCLLSWYGSALLILASWNGFQNNAISFVVETTYLETDSSFPSISVCEDDNMLRVYEVSQQMFGEDHDCNLDEVLREISFFKGNAYYIKEFCFSGDIPCPRGNYSHIAEKVRSLCSGVFTECKWRGKTFDCCKHFRRVNTELGPCFTFSSKFENPGDPEYLYTLSNRRVGLGSLTLDLNVPTKIFMHSESDMPFYNTMTTDILSTGNNVHKHFRISVKDIENEPEVRQLSVEQRKCRFPDENYVQVADEYSYSACVVDCRRKEQLKVCNCTSHLMPKSDPKLMCDMVGIYCLNKYYSRLSVQKTSWSLKEGLICDCLPGCNEPEYNIVTVTTLSIPENRSVIDISLDRLPSERYKRTVVRGRLDLVVSMGGAAGLFVGASLLSFVELIYFLLFRFKDNENEDDENDNSALGKKISTSLNIQIIGKSEKKEILKQTPFVPMKFLH